MEIDNMKKFIGKIQTKVVDHKGTEYTPVVYDLGYGHNSIIFEGVNGVCVGCWGVDSILTTSDKMYLDFGQGWYVTGLDQIKEELKAFL
jgi:hypothetical protein